MEKKTSKKLLLFIIIAFFLAGSSMQALNKKIISLIFYLTSITMIFTFYLYPNKKKIINFFTSKRARKEIESSFQLLLLLSILICIYLLFYFDLLRFKIDLSETKKFTLSNQTEQILKQIKTPINIKLFDSRNIEDELHHILKIYTAKNKLIKYQLINPVKHPLQVKQYNITQDSTLVFITSNKTPLILPYSDMSKESQDQQGNRIRNYLYEESISSTLLSLTDLPKKKIYFLSGHKEKSIKNNQGNGLSFLKEALQRENLQVESWHLPSKKKLPKSADLLILHGSKMKWSLAETTLIKSFLKKNQAFFLLLDPSIDIRYKATGLENLLSDYNIFFNDDLVIDPVNYVFQIKSSRGSPITPVLNYDEKHSSITLLEKKGLFPIFLSTRSIKKNRSTENVKHISLITSTKTAWGETNPTVGAPPKYDKKLEQKGPLVVGLLTEIKRKTEANNLRIAVMGDSDFANNHLISMGGNKDLYLNIVHWLMKEEKLFSIRTKEHRTKNINLGKKEALNVFFLFTLGIPLLTLLMGLFATIKKPHFF